MLCAIIFTSNKCAPKTSKMNKSEMNFYVLYYCSKKAQYADGNKISHMDYTQSTIQNKSLI